MDKEDAYALLLQDVEGFKESASFLGYGKEWKSITVTKGSLLTRLNPSVVNTIQKDYKCLVNYRVDDSVKKLKGDSPVKNVELLFVDSDVLFYVSRLQRDFMLGVRNPSSRLEVLGRLEWVELLVKGSEVYVTIPTITAPVRGFVRYIGGLPGEEGRKFGVELMEKKGQGTHNGSFKETEFFKCGKDCAVFVAMDKLTDGNTFKAAKVTPASGSSLIKSAVTDKNGDPIRLGDYVIFYNKFNTKHRGTVRWIGNNKAILPDGTPIVGIEAETHLNLNDVPHNIKDRYIRDYFTSKKSSKVVLPITFVLRDTSSSYLADKQESVHGSSGASPNSPHVDNIQAPQSRSMIRRESDIEATQQQSSTQGDNDAKILQPLSLPNRNQPLSKHKVEHNYDTLQDLIIPDSCNPYNLEVGSLVQYMDLNQYGVIKWIGPISGDKNVYAGLEMEDDVSESGKNGELMNVKYFDCKRGKGKFVILTSLKPDKRSKKILDNTQPVEPNPCNLKIGSVIEHGDPIKYGEIKWIGELHDTKGLFAGVEMDDDVDEANDGEWAGREYFKCKKSKGTFILLSGLQPGKREKLEGIQPTNKASTFDSVHKHINSNANKQQNQYDLKVESAVQFGDPLKYGVIKWIGTIPDFGEALQAGLKMEHEEDNFHDGTHNGIQYFPGRGRFVELNILQPHRRVESTSTEDAEKNHDDSKEDMLNVQIGSRIKHSGRYGLIKWVGNLVGLSNEKYAGVEMEEVVSNPKDGVWRGEKIYESLPRRGKFLPLSALQPDDRCVEESQLNNTSDSEYVACKFEVTDMIQFDNPPQYGTIRWIGTLPGLGPGYAGIETEDYVIDPTDGKWKGILYFQPPAGKGKFLQLSKLKLDERFIIQTAQVNPLEKHKTKIEICVKSPSVLVPTKHIGLPKGIQGQQNSCYLDATLYGMFAFSDAFDGLFLEREIGGKNHEIQEIIQQNIVYPLRKYHIVPQESVLELRSCLDKVQKSKGLIADEKDPEEFLNILFKHVFHLESYLKIRRSTGKEGEFFIQLFLEPDANVSPDTESLLHKMFVDQGIIFDQYPTRLLLQVPRYGKHFKVFRKVIPKLELDVTTICNLEQPCLVCGNGGSVMCSECCKEEAFVNGVKKPFFCNTCSDIWHDHNKRKQHKPWVKKCQDFTTGTLQLLSVLCIETSHYVCFTRITGSGKDEWVFFDSMAERHADEFNRPEVRCCTDTLNEWVYGDKDIINTAEKPPQLARRFVSDVYLCIYVDKEGTMYQ